MSSLFFQKYVMSIFQSLVCISAMFHIASCAFLAKSILKASTVFVIIAIRIFFPCYIFDVLCWFIAHEDELRIPDHTSLSGSDS